MAPTKKKQAALDEHARGKREEEQRSARKEYLRLNPPPPPLPPPPPKCSQCARTLEDAVHIERCDTCHQLFCDDHHDIYRKEIGYRPTYYGGGVQYKYQHFCHKHKPWTWFGKWSKTDDSTWRASWFDSAH